MTDVSTDRLTSLCLDALLRCIRRTVSHGIHLTETPLLRTTNLELLLYYWALSDGVRTLAETVVERPRSLGETWDLEEVERSGEISGSINAAATVLAQARTQDPCLHVLLEPTSTIRSGPNHLVQWVIREALHVLLSTRRKTPGLDAGYAWLDDRIAMLETALRNDVLREIQLSPLGRRRPAISAVRTASKARVPVYARAVEAFRLMESIDAGDEEAVRHVLRTTLIASLADWQMLELGAALAAATALGDETGQPVILEFPIVGNRPLAVVGRYSVYWQLSVRPRSQEHLDTSESWVREAAENLGVNTGAGRADIAVCAAPRTPIGLVECKFIASPASSPGAVFDAAGQLVRYARDLHPGNDEAARMLLGQSIIIVTDRGELAERVADATFVGLSDVAGIEQGSLREWVRRLTASASS